MNRFNSFKSTLFIALAIASIPRKSFAAWALPLCDQVNPALLGLDKLTVNNLKIKVLCLDYRGIATKRVYTYAPSSSDHWDVDEMRLDRIDEVRAYLRTNAGSALLASTVLLPLMATAGAYWFEDFRAARREEASAKTPVDFSSYGGEADAGSLYVDKVDAASTYAAERESLLKAASERLAKESAEVTFEYDGERESLQKAARKRGENDSAKETSEYKAERDSILKAAREREASTSPASILLNAQELLIPYEAHDLRFYGNKISASRVPKGVSRYMDGTTGRFYIVQHVGGWNQNSIIPMTGFEAIQIVSSKKMDVAPAYFGETWSLDMYKILADPWELSKMNRVGRGRP